MTELYLLEGILIGIPIGMWVMYYLRNRAYKYKWSCTEPDCVFIISGTSPDIIPKASLMHEQYHKEQKENL